MHRGFDEPYQDICFDRTDDIIDEIYYEDECDSVSRRRQYRFDEYDEYRYENGIY
jgi:hypothetical protein